MINLATLQAHKAALEAKGWLKPTAAPVVEDLGGDASGVPATPAQQHAAAAAASMMGLPPAPPKPTFAEGMTATPSGYGSYNGPAEPSAGMFAAAPPPGLVEIEEQAKAATLAPAAPPGPAPVQGTFTDPKTGVTYDMDAAAAPASAIAKAKGYGAPAGAGGGGYAPAGPVTMDDKKKALLLPGQEAAFQNEQEFKSTQGVWAQAEIDKKLETEAHLAEMEAVAVAEQSEKLATEAREREEFQSYYEAEHAKLAADSDKIAKTKLDPHRMFTGENGWLAVAAATAAAVFGVMGAPATGGRNMGVEAVQAGINRDLDLQEKDLVNKKGEVTRKTSLLGQKYAVFGNMQQAKAAARIDAYKLAIAKANSYAMQSGVELHAISAAKFTDAANREIEREKENFDLAIEGGWKSLQAQKLKDAAAAAAANAKDLKEQNKEVFKASLEVVKKRASELGGTLDQLKVPVEIDGHVLPAGTPVVIKGGKIVEAGVGDGAGNIAVTTLTPSPAGGFVVGSANAKSKTDAAKWGETNAAITEALSEIDSAIAAREAANGGEIFDQGKGTAMGTSLALKVKEASKGLSSDSDMQLIQTMVPPDVLATHPIKGMLPGDDPTMAKLKLMKQKLQSKKKINDATHLAPGQPQTTGDPATLAAPVK